MAAEHHIHARIGVLFKKARLMFQRNNELIRVDIRHQSRKAHALVRAVARVFVILAADDVKAVVNQPRFVLQHDDTAVAHKPLHLPAALGVFQLFGAEPAEEALRHVVVAPAGIHAQPAFHRPERSFHRLRIVDSVHGVIKDIARDENDIRVLRVDLFDHVLDAFRADAVSQMQIRDEHHAQAFAPAAVLGDLGVIAFHGQLGRVMNTQNAG